MHGMIQTGARLFIIDFFSVTPVFRTESVLLLKFTCIFLKAPSRKQHFFSIFTWRALVRNRTLMIPCLCNVLFTGLQYDTTLDSLSALNCEISLKKHTYIHMYIHTYIQTNMTWTRFPSFVGLRLRIHRVYICILTSLNIILSSTIEIIYT